MIVAYHNGQVQYAYKGGFNAQLDFAWYGANFSPKNAYTKIVDNCGSSNGTPPEPVNPTNSWAVQGGGVTFDKHNYNNHFGNCDTDRYNHGSPDCRWENCNPKGIGNHKQMTLAIFVRGLPPKNPAGADSCKALKASGKLLTDGYAILKSGYRVFCSNALSGGGWTQVWKHAYGEVCGWNHGCINNDMYRTFSKSYHACTAASKYCNIPAKASVGTPTEQMIVAYHNGQVQYAYKGGFNAQLDFAWYGANFSPKNAYTKIVDNCGSSNGTPPEPVNPTNSWAVQGGGVTFDKHNYNNHFGNCDTDRYNHGSPDCRWENCNPKGIGNHKQMTLAIFVR